MKVSDLVFGFDVPLKYSDDGWYEYKFTHFEVFTREKITYKFKIEDSHVVVLVTAIHCGKCGFSDMFQCQVCSDKENHGCDYGCGVEVEDYDSIYCYVVDLQVLRSPWHKFSIDPNDFQLNSCFNGRTESKYIIDRSAESIVTSYLEYKKID